MSLTLSKELIRATKSSEMKGERENLKETRREEEETFVNVGTLSKQTLQDILQAASSVEDGKTARAMQAIIDAHDGKFDKAIPNFKAFQGVLEAFLRKDLIDGWIYVESPDGKVYPELVVGIKFDDANHYRNSRKDQPCVILHTAYYGLNTNREMLDVVRTTHDFFAGDCTKKSIEEALSLKGIYKETKERKAAYAKSLAWHNKSVRDKFAEQFRASGMRHYGDDRKSPLANRKVIHDVDSSSIKKDTRHLDCFLLDKPEDDGIGVLPDHPVVKVFDLKTHEGYWINSDFLTPYVYDKSLRDKLILPDSHRDLLDILTTDLDAFVDDFIEGKSAGNIILCKGPFGTGKTLTAEVYSEIIERPLYSIHTGDLGTTAEAIQSNLEIVFERSKRWKCVLLLDEADVFVIERGTNIEQNAIVAEFLRTTEYFDGLFFMTTNREDNIDGAMLSRLAAIITYENPDAQRAAAIWRVIATQFRATLDDSLIEKLTKVFPKISARDIKMLLRMVLRVSKKKREPVSVDMFRRCAMFRAVTITETLEID